MKSKSALRSHFKNLREKFLQDLKEKERQDLDHQIQINVFQCLEALSYETLSAYCAKRDEINLTPLLERLSMAGKTLALPLFEKNDEVLAFKRWHPTDPLVFGTFDTYQPSKIAPDIIPHVMILPMLAFDDAGHRLGYGKGHFDRTLHVLRKESSIITVGVALSIQHVKHLPSEPHDVSLDFIVTEKGIYRF
jgi:5-formyltetrahydrofolate cyclo-ligase